MLGRPGPNSTSCYILFNSFSNPFTPIPVCLGPRIAINVPFGSDALRYDCNFCLIINLLGKGHSMISLTVFNPPLFL